MGINLGIAIPWLKKSSNKISFKLGLFLGSTTKIFLIKFLAASLILQISGK